MVCVMIVVATCRYIRPFMMRGDDSGLVAFRQWTHANASAGAGSILKLREALVIGGANKLARRMSRHNGYKTLGEHATLAQLHPSTARIAPDDDGLLPEWVVYNEMVATAKTFLSKVRLRRSQKDQSCHLQAQHRRWDDLCSYDNRCTCLRAGLSS